MDGICLKGLEPCLLPLVLPGMSPWDGNLPETPEMLFHALRDLLGALSLLRKVRAEAPRPLVGSDGWDRWACSFQGPGSVCVSWNHLEWLPELPG